jgi:hypothetical protein
MYTPYGSKIISVLPQPGYDLASGSKGIREEVALSVKRSSRSYFTHTRISSSFFRKYMYNCSESSVSATGVCAVRRAPGTENRPLTAEHHVIPSLNHGRESGKDLKCDIPSGQAVTNFNVATGRQYTDSNGQMVRDDLVPRLRLGEAG